jgi:pSer/pThr/pTyr-binding forkhead associated (FHA) protein
VDKRRILIGRSRECDVQVEYANVSRRHAELRQEGASYWIVDLDSTNGIEVNGRKLKRSKLEDGDRVTMGSTDILFRRERAA